MTYRHRGHVGPNDDVDVGVRRTMSELAQWKRRDPIDRLIAALSVHRGIKIGRNQPYAPDDGVFYTLERHAAGRETAMIEVRNDQLRDEIGQRRWARLLVNALGATITAT